ncbi:hypothetical protein J5N97_005997 [Dioscorea zingiberensis]|uniref:BHLH domain-containing protein n=1 Tax=Dioscorea zingiberensis TaxID=325984 RepID=A0A9D5D9I7_9LILI|nr:hypothetical protein J5N97_005997 [Dioscorea zingiberensis]
MENHHPSPHQAHKEKRKGGAGKRGGTVKLSTEPQSIAARQRRHRISDRFKILKSLVPGGSKMDTVSMLEEAIHYVKFLKTQIWLHQAALMAQPFPFSCSNNTTVTNGDHVYTTIDHASPFPPSSSSSPVLPSTHQIVSSSFPPPSSPLPPLPFKGEEEMLSYVGLNY